MGLRFRQSFQLFPGVRLNLGKGGVSASFGIPGATVNFGPNGARSTVGVPGTGFSYTHHHRQNRGLTPDPLPQQNFVPVSPLNDPAYWRHPSFAMRQINSASVEELTSESLVELRDMISEARSQRAEIESDLHDANKLFLEQTKDLDKRQKSIFRYFYKRRIAELQDQLPTTQEELDRLQGWLKTTNINMFFETSLAAKQAYGAVVRSFEKLRNSTAIWDITSDRDTIKVIERTAASRTLTRTPVQLCYAETDLIKFDGKALRFENSNGEPILIYPGVIMMPREDGAFALIDIREVQLEAEAVNFIEEEVVPSDGQIVGQTWAKVNKNGSPDLRFANNYQIPICLYGRILFTTAGGVREEYQFSNANAAIEFGDAFKAYQLALSA